MPVGARRSYGAECTQQPPAYPSWSFGQMVGLVDEGGEAPAAAAPPVQTVASGSRARCGKCDGAHETERCPHFRGARDRHPDAWQKCSEALPDGARAGRQCCAPRALPRHAASVVRMPGDGSCLFHSVAFGLRAAGYQEDGRSVRARAANFILQNPEFQISGTPLRDWIHWDSQATVREYAYRLSAGGLWGGAIEMAACAEIFAVDVAVYEEDYRGFRRISDFLTEGTPRGTVFLVYLGRSHYDALQPAGSARGPGTGRGRPPDPDLVDRQLEPGEDDDWYCAVM